ncbi:1-phosphatidylinositol 4 [Durusdinium trenchii]|uniref:Phosphoinositide phospholipase C n=1 Tax=Durusdinium trenchii TaxID=1381693 RepID=A0ABP0KNB3_9DINO
MSNHIVLREWGEVLPTELRTTVGGHMQVEKGSAWPDFADNAWNRALLMTLPRQQAQKPVAGFYKFTCDGSRTLDRWLLLSLALVLAWRHFQRPHLRSALLAGEALVAEKRKKSSKEAAKKELSVAERSAQELTEAVQCGFAAARGSGEESKEISVRLQSGKECQFLCLAPGKFKELRSLWGLTEELYWTCLSEDLRGGSPESSGKSGSLFWVSQDRLLVLKTLERLEMKTLLQCLPRYEQHFSTYKHSLLCRFFGAYEAQVGRRRVPLVVMNNAFPCLLQPNVVYDLKGTTEDRWVSPRPGVVLKDLNFADKIIGIPDVNKKAALLHAFKKDSQFLRSLRVMDYSVCLGVHYCEGSYPDVDYITAEPGISSSLAVLKGYEPKYQCTLLRTEAAQKVIYFISIIDILQQYTLRKVIAHTFKSLSLGWLHEIDTAPPHYYARRFKTSFTGKVQCFREPEDRVARFSRRLRLAIEAGTIACPTFINPMNTDSWDVTLDEAVDFAVRCGGQLMVARQGLLRSRMEEVEAFLDMDRHALIFQEMARSPFGGGRRPTSAVACYKIRRVYLTIVCHRPRDLYCIGCRSHMKVEAEPQESRRFTVEADDAEPLRFVAPSRRQAELWATALEVAAGYVEANVEDTSGPANVGAPDGPNSSGAIRSAERAAILGSLDEWVPIQAVLAVARPASQGLLEPYLLGPEAERRWQKRRLKWIFGFIDTDGTGALPVQKINLLWHELNINSSEGQQVLSAVLRQEKQGRRAGGGRQIGGGRLVNLMDWAKMLTLIDQKHVKAVYRALRDDLYGRQRSCSVLTCEDEDLALRSNFGHDVQIAVENLAQFFTNVQGVWPPPSVQQVQRMLSRIPFSKERSLSTEALAQLLCSPGNALADPAKRSLFQDMTQPLCAYFVDTSHNTYLEGNQLSSRSSVLRYVEVLRAGCRSVEVDVWDGKNGEPMVKHGYTVTTEVLFQDVVQAIADHAFVASEYPLVISIEQHCCALQRVRQGQIMEELLGEQLLRPPWDEQRQRIDPSVHFDLSPWSARRRVLVKSSIGCCERCRGPLPTYDRCIALPTRKLLQKLVDREADHPGAHGSLSPVYGASVSPAASGEPSYPWHVASGTAAKVQKLEKSIGRSALCSWTSAHLARVYPEGTRIGSGNVDPMSMWLSGVQMVAMNYQTNDTGLLLNQGLFRHYNGSCGYVLKPSIELVPNRAPKRLWLCICCGHRLPKPDGSRSSEVSSPHVLVSLFPGGQVSQTPQVNQDGYHPVFNHEVILEISESPLHILTFEVFDKGRPMARSALNLDAVREGFRWLSLQSPQGHSIPRCGLLVKAHFQSGSRAYDILPDMEASKAGALTSKVLNQDMTWDALQSSIKTEALVPALKPDGQVHFLRAQASPVWLPGRTWLGSAPIAATHIGSAVWHPLWFSLRHIDSRMLEFRKKSLENALRQQRLPAAIAVKLLAALGMWTGSAMPSEPALGPLAAPRPKVRHNVRRASVWGTNPSFQIAPIHAAGSKEPTGWVLFVGATQTPTALAYSAKRLCQSLACQTLSVNSD